MACLPTGQTNCYPSPRIPTVGQHTLGVYANYKPNVILPDWRKNRNQQETTPLEREIATEERAAIERLRAPREGDQWTNGAHAESTSALSIQGKSAGYCLRSSSFVGETVAQTIDKILPTTPAQVPINQQQLVPIAAPQQSEIPEERHLEQVCPDLWFWNQIWFLGLKFLYTFCIELFLVPI